MFTRVGVLLKTLPRRSRTPGVILALHVRSAFDDSLKKNCGDLPADVLKAVKAVSFKSGVIIVKTPTLVAAELQMRSGGLIKEINMVLGRRVVTRLRFRSS